MDAETNNPAVLICGIANERSLATAVARQLAAQQVPLCCTWQDERHRPRVERIAEELGMRVLGQLDVRDEASVAACVQALSGQRLCGLLHAIAFGRLVDDDGATMSVHEVDANRWAEAMDISARSLPSLLNHFKANLQENSGVVALTYHGARKVAPGYNLMGVAKAALESALRYCAYELGPIGIRVNAVSAGSVRTAAASAVPGFAKRLAESAERVPLRRNITADEVAKTAAWLISADASAITGAIIPVDAGDHLC